MTRPIVTDPDKFGGAPSIEGTSITVAEVQAYWEQKGVYAAEIRRRFPELSEAELGAAVIYRPHQEPEFSFVAEAEGPPRRRLYIASSPPGWEFAYDNITRDGDAQPGWDIWEEEWQNILRYPPKYADREIEWRDVKTNEPVDIYAVRPEQKR